MLWQDSSGLRQRSGSDVGPTGTDLAVRVLSSSFDRDGEDVVRIHGEAMPSSDKAAENDAAGETPASRAGLETDRRAPSVLAPPDRHPMLRAFAHRDYRLFFGGQLVSLIGTWMQSVAQSWLVYRLSGSAVLLGLVGFAGQIPVFLLSPAGGGLADTHSRHRIILGTQAASMVLALVLASLTLTGRVQLWQVFTLAALLGVVNAFDIPARQAFLVELVGRADLMNAIALNSSMFNGARIIGPALAGVLVAALGEGWCFFVNGISYVAVLAGLLLMSPRPVPARPGGGTPLGRILEGLGFAARTAPIRELLLLLGLVSLAGMPYVVLMPIFADQVLHTGAWGLGVLMGASGLGALLGALMLAARRDVRGLGRWVAWAAGGFGASLIAFAASRWFWLSTVLLVPAGFAMIVQTAASNTLIQAMVPDELRGRVMATYSMMFMGMAPFGALLAGLLAGRLGAPVAVAAGGVACIVGAIAFGSRLPALRVAGRELLVSQEMAGGHPAGGPPHGAAAAAPGR
jgi:MFS family permease